ncbi:MAG: aminotransferase, partial [Candidatus Thermoplasmatota archaeon]|nr:aminotransferase [Candidatus Thermoplasmatota archaeon]
TLVDAAHGPGLIPLDIAKLNASFVTGNCHKWLCTPKGSAFLHVRSDRLDLRPLVISHGASLPDRMGPRFRLEFDWTGTLDPTAWMCIPFAIDYLGGLFEGGWGEIMARNNSLALAARSMIMERVGLEPVCSEDFITSMAAFIIPGTPTHPDPDPLHERLYNLYDIQVPV